MQYRQQQQQQRPVVHYHLIIKMQIQLPLS